MSKVTRGFTIVELLVVIVVIAILASIATVSYRGIKERASNVARLNEVRGWQEVLQIYKVQNGDYPAVPDGNYCLGTGFPGNYCREYWQGAVTEKSYYALSPDNVTLINELKTVASPLPTNNPKPVRNGLVGPYISFFSGGYTITQVFEGSDDDCPSTMTYSWDDGNGLLICVMQVLE